MTTKEYNVARNKLEVADAESRLREARRNQEVGTQKMQVDVDKAAAELEWRKAEYNREITKLKEEVVRAATMVEKEKTALKWSEAELARGYEAT
jgi:predicted  nucleic acid-binding Zn-ribbon protein